MEARIRERIRRDAQIWIIHGGKSTVWQSLATFLVTDLELRYTEFNDPAAKRVFIQDRVETMVASSTLALAVMTAADVTECGERRARQNVVHEIGVAQGRLGFGRVIIMLQRGVETFSNMSGLVYVPFEPSKLAEALSDLRSHIVARLGI